MYSIQCRILCAGEEELYFILLVFGVMEGVTLRLDDYVDRYCTYMFINSYTMYCLVFIKCVHVHCIFIGYIMYKVPEIFHHVCKLARFFLSRVHVSTSCACLSVICMFLSNL